MSWRHVVQEYEADLYKVPMPRFFRREMGELERKIYASGEERLKIVFHGVNVPDGTNVAVVIGDDVIAEVPVERKRGRLELRTEEGQDVPAVRNGDVAEIQHDGQPLLRGTFRPD